VPTDSAVVEVGHGEDEVEIVFLSAWEKAVGVKGCPVELATQRRVRDPSKLRVTTWGRQQNGRQSRPPCGDRRRTNAMLNFNRRDACSTKEGRALP
jgi:hypothetical protein